MQKLRNQAKHFHSSHSNRVKYENFLQLHPNLPSSTILRDLNETRISSRHLLVRSSLRLKQALIMYFGHHQLPQYLSEEDWKFAQEIEAVLMASKDLCTLSQNESHLNAAYGPVVRKNLHNTLSAPTMMVIDTNRWGRNVKAPRSSKLVSDFSEYGAECRRRAKLECERRFFGNTSEEVFPQGQCSVGCKNREKGVLLLDKRTCCNMLIMKKGEWEDAVHVLESFYIDFYVNAKKKDREERGATAEATDAVATTDQAGPDLRNDEDNMIDIFDEGEVTTDNGITANYLQERDQRLGKTEYRKVIREWCKYRVPWRTIFHWLPKERPLDPFHDLMSLNMSPVMANLMRYSETHDGAFGYLPLMCKSSPCQLGALNSQAFAERMISGANLIITKKRTRLDDELLEKLIVLRMNKKYIEKQREKGRNRLTHVAGIADS